MKLLNIIMKKKIVLIGRMGSGKTTVGRIVSKRLKINFIDTDVLIEKNCGIKIRKIFDKYGEEYFRRKEEERTDFYKHHNMLNLIDD